MPTWFTNVAGMIYIWNVRVISYFTFREARRAPNDQEMGYLGAINGYRGRQQGIHDR